MSLQANEMSETIPEVLKIMRLPGILRVLAMTREDRIVSDFLHFVKDSSSKSSLLSFSFSTAISVKRNVKWSK